MTSSVLVIGTGVLVVVVVVGSAVMAFERRSIRRQADADMRSCLTNIDRLRALEHSGLLDQRPRPELDELTRHAAESLEAPIAVMSLVGADRQYFTSQYGLKGELATVKEVVLDHSYCKHVVASGGPFVVGDAEHHPVVGDSYAATQAAGAYLGVPVRSREGHVLGSFCVVDHQPRQWADKDCETLARLAHAAEAFAGI